jgi:RHH-type rel operon transcriptional repressor/antitoxin RelB
MIALRDKNLEERIDRLARESGRSRSYYVRQAIENFLEEREDYLLAVAALERREPTITLDELEARLALDSPDRAHRRKAD